jgi:hypothetical protein
MVAPDVSRSSSGQASAGTWYPRVRPNVEIKNESLSRQGEVIQIEPAFMWPVVEGLFRRADGTRSVADLAAELGTPPGVLGALLEELDEHGFVWLSPVGEAIPVPEFQAEFRRWVSHWVEHIYADPIWSEVVAGRASPAVLVGWALENIHYTRTVARHMTLAASNADASPESRTMLRHLSEEWDHYGLFLTGVCAVGFPRDVVERAAPLASTRAITAFMRREASLHPLVFNGCEALLESTAEDPDAICDFYEIVRARYDYPEAFTARLIRHVRVDESFEHVDIFDELLRTRAELPFELAFDILDACAKLADLLALWHADLARFYGAFDRPVVRTHDHPLVFATRDS